jgi:uncharacterized protein YqgV (UPF0045/DUF77 family)
MPGSPEEAAQVGLQLSVYPLRQGHLRPAIESAVKSAAAEGVAVSVGPLSTVARGDEDSIFRALRAAFTAAKPFGPVVVVATLASGLPADETVAEIQSRIGEPEA